MLYIANAFSLQMLEDWRFDETISDGAMVSVTALSDPAAYIAEAKERHGGLVSAVGHADTANVFSAALSWHIPAERRSITIGEDDELVVGQVVGGRLVEGATQLPEGVSIRWLLVKADGL